MIGMLGRDKIKERGLRGWGRADGRRRRREGGR